MSYQLTITSLVCNDSEDLFGSDEPYIRVNGSKVFSGTVENNNDIDVGKSVIFSNQANIQLFDRDQGEFNPFDTDDFLGSKTVTSKSALLGDDPQTAYFSGNGFNYELNYIVTDV